MEAALCKIITTDKHELILGMSLIQVQKVVVKPLNLNPCLVTAVQDLAEGLRSH